MSSTSFTLLCTSAVVAFLALLTLSTGQIDRCYCDQADFNETCANLTGFVVGRSCFFFKQYANTSWTNAWTTCQKYGAVFGSILTRDEYLAVKAHIKTYTWPVWFALKKNNDSLPFLVDNTFWYDSANSYRQTFSAANTYVRNCLGDFVISGYYSCMGVSTNGLTYNGPCSRGTETGSALCRLADIGRRFVKFNVCLTEVAIETAIAATPKDCAVQCSQRHWCQSINYYASGSVAGDNCHLFPWQLSDTNKTAQIANCVTYNMVHA